MKFGKAVLVNLVASLMAAIIILLFIRVSGYLETSNADTVGKTLLILIAMIVACIAVAWISETIAKDTKLDKEKALTAETIQGIAAVAGMTLLLVFALIFIFYYRP